MTNPEPIDALELSPLDRVKQLAATTLSDAELSRLATWARLEEPQRRKEAESAKAAAASATQEVVEQVWQLQPSLKPEFSDSPEGEVPAWVEPTGDLTSYPAGAHVAHQERVWRNDLGALNLSTPGDGHGWEDVTPIVANGSRSAPYPWQVGQDLDGGDYVEHDGQLYIVTATHTTTETTPDQLVGDLYERIN